MTATPSDETFGTREKPVRIHGSRIFWWAAVVLIGLGIATEGEWFDLALITGTLALLSRRQWKKVDFALAYGSLALALLPFGVDAFYAHFSSEPINPLLERFLDGVTLGLSLFAVWVGWKRVPLVDDARAGAAPSGSAVAPSSGAAVAPSLGAGAAPLKSGIAASGAVALFAVLAIVGAVRARRPGRRRRVRRVVE